MPEAVRLFLLAHSDLFKVRPALDDFQLEETVAMSGVRHYHMAQLYRGVLVLGGSYNVAVDEQGRVVMVTGNVIPGLAGDVRPTLDPHLATQIARASVPGGQVDDSRGARLVVRAEKGEARPVFEVAIRGRSSIDAWNVLVDARTGVVVDRSSTVMRLDGLGNVFDSNPVDGPVHSALIPNLLTPGLTAAGQYVEVHNLSGPDLVNRASGDFRPDDPTDSLKFAQVHAYYHADRFLAYLRSLGYSDTTRLRIYVNDPNVGESGGFYFDNDKTVHFSRWAGVGNPAYDAGIIAHEVQHFVTARLGYTTSTTQNGFAGGNNTSEYGALQEGISEYFQGAYPGEPRLGIFNDITTCAPSTGYVAPSVANDTRYFRMPNYDALHVCGWSSFDDHTNGLILAGALWDLRSRIGSTLTDQLAIQAIPFLPAYPTMGCYFDALCAADQLFHGAHEFFQIIQVRANRYLNCKPDALIQGQQIAFIGQVTTYNVVPNLTYECGIVPYASILWQRRPRCLTAPCAPWTSTWDEGNGFSVADTVPNAFDLQAIVSDVDGRAGTTPILQGNVYYPMTMSISGPSTIDLGACQSGQWAAIVTGHAPFRYLWTWAGTTVGFGATASWTPSTSGTYSLSLSVTDADGQSRAMTWTILVTGSCGPILPVPRAITLGYSQSLLAGVHSAEVELASPAAIPARLEVCDVFGRRVAMPFDGDLQAGRQRVSWATSSLPSGVYFYRLTAPGASITRRFILLR